jgi:hypothetical protein
MAARTPRSGDDLTALPLHALRQLVYAEGADEGDERWIRAAAELTRRERASSPAAGDGGDPDDSTEASDAPADADAGRSGSRTLAWAGGALVVGLLAGAGIAAGVGGSSAPSAAGTTTPTPSATATDEAPRAPDPESVRSLLGTDISRTSAPVPVDGILAAPQEEADAPPRSPGGDIDLTSIRGVQTRVGLYVARTISSDACLLVYP